MPPLALILAALGVGAVVFLLPRKAGEKLLPTPTEKERLAALQPQVRDALARVRARLSAKGVRILIGSTRRTVSGQAAIVAAGNSATSNSWHLLGRAVDVYPYGPDGKPDLAGKYVDLFKAVHAEAVKEGFRGLAFNPDGSKKYITTNKGKVWDGGHLEYPQGMTFAQAASKDGIKTA